MMDIMSGDLRPEPEQAAPLEEELDAQEEQEIWNQNDEVLEIKPKLSWIATACSNFPVPGAREQRGIWAAATWADADPPDRSQREGETKSHCPNCKKEKSILCILVHLTPFQVQENLCRDNHVKQMKYIEAVRHSHTADGQTDRIYGM